ncbi:hypothetical protein [Dictyoglomus sp.]
MVTKEEYYDRNIYESLEILTHHPVESIRLAVKDALEVLINLS